MNKKFFGQSLLATTLFTAAGTMPALAQIATPDIDRAQAAVSARIQYGISTGRITPREAEAVQQLEREIRRREQRIKADGRITRQERIALHSDVAAWGDEVERRINNTEVAWQDNRSTRPIDNRQAEIHARIEQGVASGHITRREARRLHEREREIQDAEASFMADGRLSVRERRQLRQDLTMLRDEVETMMANNRYDFNRDGRRDFANTY